VIADDHAPFREGLKSIFAFEKDVVVVGEAAQGDEVGAVIENTRPDVLLLDLKMPRAEAVQILAAVSQKNPATKVLVLTAFSEEENIVKVAKGGARGYVLKGVDSSTLIQAIKTVHGGDIWVDREILYAAAFEEIARTIPYDKS
jgi:DNA-binding NarL/FixJ family response regulator